MEITIISKVDGTEIDGSLFFLDDFTDGGSASILTTLLSIKNDFKIFINGKEI